MPPLLNVDTAIEKILERIERIDSEQIPITLSHKRILAQDVKAEVALPPFDNAAVDGYALYHEDIVGASQDNGIRLNVTMDILAGQAPTKALARGTCARIMTGAPIPQGANCVIRVEDTDSNWQSEPANKPPQQVRIFHAGQEGENIRLVGESIRAGEIVLKAGDAITPAGIGMLVALGVTKVHVLKRPRVAILSSGDELLTLEEPLTPGKIRDVNSYTLAIMCEDMGAEVVRLPIARDTPESIRQLFEDALKTKPHLIISSAGVSVGAVDYVRDILEEMGSIDLWRINLRPGKPLAYGQLQGIPFFGLPGNPVSAMVTFDVLVRPALEYLSGYQYPEFYVEALTTHPIHSDGRRSYLRVYLETINGRYYATETGTQSSGALMSMVQADGLLIVPEDVKYVESNRKMKVKLLKPLKDYDL
jgi:molybdopterin molybdotransferase